MAISLGLIRLTIFVVYTCAVLWKANTEVPLDGNKNRKNADDVSSEVEGDRDELLEELMSKHYSSSTEFLYSKSPLHLIHLARFDRTIYTNLKQYAQILQERLLIFSQYVEDFEKYSLPSNPSERNVDADERDWASKISSHPIMALRLIRRMTSRLPSILYNIEAGKENDLIEEIYHAKKKLDWPSKQDLQLITQSLIDLPIVYDIPIRQISEGHAPGLMNSEFPVTLDAAECNEIAVAAFKKDRFASAIQWLDAAWNRFYGEGNDESIPYDILEMNLNIAVQDHDLELENLTSRVGELSGQWDQDLFEVKVHGLKTFENRTLRHLHSATHKTEDVHDTPRFWRMCSGDNFRLTDDHSSLRCFFQSHHHPYFIINPLKVEILHEYPIIVQVHDFVSQSTTRSLIAHATPQIETLNGIGPLNDPRNLHSGEEKALVPATLEIKTFHGESNLMNFEEKIRLLSKVAGRLDPPPEYSSEKLNVGLYSFGTYDKVNDIFPHDESGVPEEETVVTHIFLNSMEIGGRTVFPTLGFGVQPLHGSLLIWTEFKVNGVPHSDLLWTNCPVVSGHKWVASKYFRRVGNHLGYINIFSYTDDANY